MTNKEHFEILYLRKKGNPSKYSHTLSKIFHYNVNKIDSLTQLYYTTFEHIYKHKGERFAIKRMKAYLSAAQRIAAGMKVEPWRFTSLDSEGIPQFLGEYLSLLKGTNRTKQLALTILSLGRLYECRVDTYDTSSVTARPPIDYQGDHRPGSYFNQCSIDPDLIDLDKFNDDWKFVLNSLFSSQRRDERISELKTLNSYHITGRNGPNGHSLGCAYRDMIALVADRETGGRLIERISQLTEVTDNNMLLCHLEDCPNDKSFLKAMGEELSEGKTFYHSKLNLKQGEPWWKERIFASGDFFTQSSLLGIQRWMSKTLRKNIWTFDGSLDQSQVLMICKQWTEHTFPFSKDLTTATDLLPIDLLGEICVQLFGLEIGNAWLEVMRDRSFYDSINDEHLRYNTGNPMGFYTSWYLLHYFQIIMYLTIERYHGLSSSLSLEIPRFVIVGDDSSTNNKDISNTYDIIMSKLLGVPQSPFKGFSPDMSEKQSLKACEMCKRIFINGVDVSPISPRVILDGICDPISFPNMHLHIEERVESHTMATTIELLVPIANHKLKSLKVLANPIMCPNGLHDLELINFGSKALDEHIKFIITISDDAFYASFTDRVIREIVFEKIKAYQWIEKSYRIFLPLEFGGEIMFQTLPRSAQIEPQLALLEDVLSFLTTMILEADQAIFPIGYAHSLSTCSIPDQAKLIWKAIKQLIVLDNLPRYLGYGRVDRDEKGKAFGKRFNNLLTEVLLTVGQAPDTPIVDSELTLKKVEFALALSVFQCEPERESELLQQLAMITQSASVPARLIDEE